MSAIFGFDDDNETPQQSAIAVMDVHAGRAGLPTYSELVDALRNVTMCSEPRGDAEPIDTYELRRSMLKAQRTKARALLARIPT